VLVPSILVLDLDLTDQWIEVLVRQSTLFESSSAATFARDNLWIELRALVLLCSFAFALGADLTRAPMLLATVYTRPFGDRLGSFSSTPVLRIHPVAGFAGVFAKVPVATFYRHDAAALATGFSARLLGVAVVASSITQASCLDPGLDGSKKFIARKLLLTQKFFGTRPPRLSSY
jgi:hypothetical protein